MRILVFKGNNLNHLLSEFEEREFNNYYPSNIRQQDVQDVGGYQRNPNRAMSTLGTCWLIDIVSRDTGMVEAVAFCRTHEEARNLYKESWHGDD